MYFVDSVKTLLARIEMRVLTWIFFGLTVIALVATIIELQSTNAWAGMWVYLYGAFTVIFALMWGLLALVNSQWTPDKRSNRRQR